MDVYDLNTKKYCFEKGNVKHVLKVAEMYEELVKLKTQVKQSEYKKETLESKGSRVDECTGKSKSRLKLDLKKKMNDALWFAETCGLFSRNVICESFEDKQIEVQVSDIKTKGIRYSCLPDIEKDKLRQKFISVIFFSYQIVRTMSSLQFVQRCQASVK